MVSKTSKWLYIMEQVAVELSKLTRQSERANELKKIELIIKLMYAKAKLTNSNEVCDSLASKLDEI